MNKEHFNDWPHFDDADIAAVSEVLRSGKVNRWTGRKNSEFESAFAEISGAKYAIVLANGSLALELAMRAIGIGEGDEVITTCRTFMASASSVAMLGAVPIIADVDLTSQNITAESIAKCITPRTRAIVAVHLAGWPCDMDSILTLAKERGLYVIEDCAQAHGAAYKGNPVGALGDVAAWSFCQDKIITTCGEGGAVTTNNAELWRKMCELKDHGKSIDSLKSAKIDDSSQFKWLIESIGTNMRMTEIQCAQGILWLKKLPEWTRIRNRNAAMFNAAIGKFKCARVTIPPTYIRHAYYKYYFFIRPEFLKSGWSRNRIISEVSRRGIPCFAGACWNISAEKAFVNRGWYKGESELPNAAQLRDTSVMTVVHPTIDESDMCGACEVFAEVLAEAQK